MLACRANAGIAAENVAVVVNGDSADSVTVAAEYAKLRDIPTSNIVTLHNLSATEEMDVDHFRDEILKPVLESLRTRGVISHVTCITYSVAIPYAINVGADMQGRKFPKFATPVASINGLTYLCDLVLKKDPNYLRLDTNLNAQISDPSYSPDPKRPHPHYLYSTVLGVTAGRGNTLEEVLRSIRRSAAADFTAPKGVIYFERNGDVRSRTREWGFESAVQELDRHGVQGVVEQGALPTGHPDVAGTMMGTQDFKWATSSSSILPGAICENLTSYGAIFRPGVGQTPCTDFIRFGASGTSGTVTEPYAIQQKFPTPFIQVQYAKGFTLVESFYQSVSGPYQLLIIGDPLCRPWAKMVKLEVRKTITGQPIRGNLQFSPTTSPPTPISKYEVFVDGILYPVVALGTKLTLNTARLEPGAHLISVIATASNGPESSYRVAFRIQVAGSR